MILMHNRSFFEDLFKSLRTRKPSDWAGSLFYLALGWYLFRETPKGAILMLAPLLHEVLIGFFFLIRKAPKARATAWHLRALAYFCSFAFPVFTIAFLPTHPYWAESTRYAVVNNIGLFLFVVGSFFGLYAIWELRRSFSIEPQARELVTGGAFRFARHPVYVSYILQYLGILLRIFNLKLCAVYLVWLGLMYVRARIEEGILEKAFPSYAEYRAHVGMFGLRLDWHSPIQRSVLPSAAAVVVKVT
jgi:protein-S-isoprenylcysteine O-methyltransferase Ste14